MRSRPCDGNVLQARANDERRGCEAESSQSRIEGAAFARRDQTVINSLRICVGLDATLSSRSRISLTKEAVHQNVDPVLPATPTKIVSSCTGGRP